MRMLALTCIPIIGLSGCGMIPKAEPVAYQAPVAVAKPAPVVKKAAAPKKVAVAPRVVRKPIVQPTPSSERSEPSGDDPSPW